MITIRIADFEKDIKPLANRAKKAGVSMYNPAGAVWFCGEEDGIVFSCGCMVFNPKTKSVRWKSDFTLEEYRGRGTYKKMTQMRLFRCVNLGAKEITAFVGDKNLNQYLTLGFKIESKRPNLFYVRKQL